jgi:hypothetical protein
MWASGTPCRLRPLCGLPKLGRGHREPNTPWRRMSDGELAAEISEAGGRVFIGFKDPQAGAGVDEIGRVLASPASVAAAKAQLRALGVGVEFEFSDMPSVIAHMPANLLPQLRANPLIEYIEPIFPGRWADQVTTWNVQRVGAPQAWSSSTGSGRKLLNIDSGIDTAHPDLAPAVVQTCMPLPNDGTDQYGHGTETAGIEAAVNNTIQVVGVAYGVALWSSQVGNQTPDPGYAACAVQFGRTNQVDVMNMSFGVPPYTALTDQINAAYNQDGIFMVASAGNNYGGSVTYPANLDAVVAVSATDTNNAFASFSSAGPEVELTGPGTTVTGVRGLTTTCLGGSTCLVEGTSFSAPAVAAAAAILKAYNASWTNVDIRNRLTETATDLGAAGRDAQFGFGLLNIPLAIGYQAPSVVVSGPTTANEYSDVTVTATVSGGVSPYSYAWTIDGDPTCGNESSCTAQIGAGGYYCRFAVTVTDAQQQTASGFHDVYACPPQAPTGARTETTGPLALCK